MIEGLTKDKIVNFPHFDAKPIIFSFANETRHTYYGWLIEMVNLTSQTEIVAATDKDTYTFCGLTYLKTFNGKHVYFADNVLVNYIPQVGV